MIDIKLIRENPKYVEQALSKRIDKVNISEILDWDLQHRQLLGSVEELKKRRNQVSAQIPKLQREKQDVSKLLAEMKEVSSKIKEMDEKILEITQNIRDAVDILPNLPDDDVKAGDKENNEVWKESVIKKPDFGFEPLDHYSLSTQLGLIDYKRGVKISGNGFWLYRGDGALLEWALLNYFIAEHQKNGYEFILPPHILGYECGYTAGQFPKFTDDVYTFNTTGATTTSNGGFNHFLLPTAETVLVNLHRDEILAEDELPKKYFAYTPCYRKEGGGYRREEKGMIRGHQFNKVELFQFTLPEDSDKAFLELVEITQKLVESLGLHYRVAKLAAKDCSDSMSKTFDIEVWLPSISDYKEVSSISKASCYQARRGGIRFKRRETGKNEFVHTLNASGLATSRLFPAILEQLQQKDGSVIVPEPLRKWLPKERLIPKDA